MAPCPPQSVRLVMLDSHAAVRDMLSEILRRDGLYEICGGAATREAAVQLCSEHQPALAIVDLLLAEQSGVQAMRAMRQMLPGLKIVIFSGARNRELIGEALRERPQAYVRKQDPLASLLEALRVVARGGSYFSDFAVGPHALASRETRHGEAGLTSRENSVLQMIAQGRRNKEIAALLGISPKTAEHHRANLMDKLGIREVAKLTRYAIRRGLVEDEEA